MKFARRALRFWLGVAVTVGGLVVLVGVMLAAPNPLVDQPVFGVTFAPQHAEGIGLDWREAYRATLSDLGVRNLRLGAYWNVIEPEDDVFDFSVLDYQMDLAAEQRARVILSVGRKIQRWPECHEPGWVDDMPEAEQQEEILEMLAIVVERYREHPALRMWQLENEPFLDFGDCPPGDAEFLAREEALVRSLDSAHPILVTDSGELNLWWTASGYGDLLGTTMYRTVFSSRTQKPFGYDYIFPSWGYRLKSRYVQLLRGKDVLISELQGEPWGAIPFPEMTREERLKSISPERFLDLRNFATRTQLPEAYWWGVEYWYWEKEINGDASYWDLARDFF